MGKSKVKGECGGGRRLDRRRISKMALDVLISYLLDSVQASRFYVLLVLGLHSEADLVCMALLPAG